ncbi:hypothetical protein [Metasolibacillus meyeri]|uniref:hypothetical protein n=1 Tax=Metasolibacillus meyeri TaxID=1071052 RepID=UPI000D3271D5|nr:hypothetical protein [Metasolibacillus meyeri]
MELTNLQKFQLLTSVFVAQLEGRTSVDYLTPEQINGLISKIDAVNVSEYDRIKSLKIAVDKLYNDIMEGD